MKLETYLVIPMDQTCRDQHQRWLKQGEEQNLLSSWGNEPRAPRLWGGTETRVAGSVVAVNSWMSLRCSPWLLLPRLLFTMLLGCSNGCCCGFGFTQEEENNTHLSLCMICSFIYHPKSRWRPMILCGCLWEMEMISYKHFQCCTIHAC